MPFRSTLLILAAPLLGVAQISGVVRDPSGGAVADAAVTLNQLTTKTGAQGQFRFVSLTPGAWRLGVSLGGFESYEQTVNFSGAPVELSITLELASLKTSVTVSGGSLRNSDPNYQALRHARLEQVWRVHDLTLRRDAATLTFRSGAFGFLQPVLGRVAAAVFVGDGNLTLTPRSPLAAHYMRTLTRSETADEDFTSMVVYFTDSTYEEITRQAEEVDESPQPLQSALEEIQSASRRRTDDPASYLETLLGDDDVPNLDADALARLYNHESGVFRAFLHGKKHGGLRFILDPYGAAPVMPAAEEVALLNYATGQDADGIWYLSHLTSEVAAQQGSPTEDHRALAPESYRIDATIGSSLNLAAQCSLRFTVLRAGLRMTRFQLLPDLEVSQVTFDGAPISFIQESRRRDGSFYIEFPTPLDKNSAHELGFTYSGGEFIREIPAQRAYSLQPLRPWYPRVDANSRATFDLTFRVPRGMTVISVGTFARKTNEKSHDVFRFIANTPIPPAGFNYGAYETSRRHDERTGFDIESYLLPPRSTPLIVGDGPAATVTNVVRSAGASDVGLANARASVELFSHWYGPLPYKRLAVTESPYIGSLPTVLFLPVAALGGIDITAYRNGAASRMERMMDETLPANASRQWMVALVAPASFHERRN